MHLLLILPIWLLYCLWLVFVPGAVRPNRERAMRDFETNPEIERLIREYREGKNPKI